MKRLKNGIYSLGEMRTNLWDGKKFYTTSIFNSFFYRSLVEKDRRMYDEYRELVNTTCRRVYKRRPKTKVAPYETFYSIYEDIRDNGYEHGSRIRFGPGRKGHGDIITDGQHRASILLYLDKDIEIKIKGRYAMPHIDSTSYVKMKK